MKKVLVTVAALGLVFGVASNALALDKPSRASEVEATDAPRVPTATAPGVALWSVSGQWVLAGAHLSNGLGDLVADTTDVADDNSDDLWIHSFKILPVLQVNDKVAMKGEIRFADRDTFGGSDNDLNGGRQIDTYHLYMEWMSPIGKTRFGRTPCGAWGSKAFNSSGTCNRIMLWGNWMPENWGMLMFHQKTAENDGFNLASDQDHDAYYIDTSYKADFGKTVAALVYFRDASGNNAGVDELDKYRFWLHGKYGFDALSVEYEVQYDFGDNSYYGSKQKKSDKEGLGLYADVGYNAGDFTFGIKGVYASGDDDASDNDNKAFMSTAAGLGRDFNPQQIMTGDYMSILNGDNPLTGNTSMRSDVAAAGAMGFIGYVQFKASPKLTLNLDLGTWSAVDEMKGYDDSYGQEIGVGMSYKLYDNLTYAAHFSYMATGDFFEVGLERCSYDECGYDEVRYTDDADTEDLWLLAHALSMKF